MKKLRYFSYLLLGIGGIAILAFRHFSGPTLTSPYYPPGGPNQYPHGLYADLKNERLADQYVSAWRERVKAVYRQKLTGSQPDILVLPFEVQMDAIDRIGRSLMARRLIRTLGRRSDKVIPGFDTVDRALGYNHPRFREAEVDTLLRAVQPSKYVRTYVGHKRRFEMYVTVSVYEKALDATGGYREIRKKTWKKLPFSDEDLPYQIFANKIDEFARFIDPNQNVDTSRVSAGAKNNGELTLPLSPLQLVGDIGSDPIAQAFALQTLGVLAPKTHARERDRLFERSLISLLEVSPEHPDYALLEARALFNLGRLPAALATLKDAKTDEAKSLRLYLNADLARFAGSVEKISSSWKRLLARVELNELAIGFGYENEFIPGWTDDFFKNYPKWQSLIASKLSENRSASGVRLAEVKRELDTFYPWSSQSLGSALAGRNGNVGSGDADLALTEAIANHVQAALASYTAAELDSSGITKADYVLLLEGWTLWSAIRRLQILIDRQALPKRASALAEKYLRIYDGHPDILFLELRADLKVWNKAQGVAKSSFRSEYPRRLARVVDLVNEHDGEFFRYQWELKTYTFAMRSDKTIELPNLYYLGWRATYIQSMFPPKYVYDVPTRDPARSIAYVHHDVGALWSEYYWMKKRGKAAALQFWDSNQLRFKGHRRLPELAALVIADKMAGKSENERDRVLGEHYRAQVDSGSIEWSPYWETALRQVVAGQFDEASSVVRKYPGFSPSSSTPALTRSNYAARAGHQFYWRGAYKQATPLYELSARQNTGSGAEMTARARLATIKGDFPTAIQYHYRRGTRYNSQFGFRDSMSLLHVLGQSEQAWALFDALLGRYKKPAIWDSALVGHRVAGKSSEEIVDWLSDESRQSDDFVRNKFLRRYALQSLTMDRPVNDDIPDILERIGKVREITVDSINPQGAGVLMKLRSRGEIYKEISLPSVFVGLPLAVGDSVPSEFALFAGGYNAIRQNNHERALEYLVSTIRLYNAGRSLHQHFAYPYLARAAVKSGRRDVLKVSLNQARTGGADFSLDSRWFYYHLGMAFIAAEDGDHDKALKYLNWAFGIKPIVDDRPVMAWYQVVEAGLWLYEDFGDERYLSRVLEWARSYQVIAPMHAWAFAVVAKYSDDPEERIRSLAMAQYLDRNSALLSDISDSEKQAAQQWFEEVRPLEKPRSTADPAAPA